jgi:hypothetical protein
MRWRASIAPWRNRWQAPCCHQKDASPKDKKPCIFFDNNVPALRLFKNEKPLAQNTAKMAGVYKCLQDSHLGANACFRRFRVGAHVSRLRRNGVAIVR